MKTFIGILTACLIVGGAIALQADAGSNRAENIGELELHSDAFFNDQPDIKSLAIGDVGFEYLFSEFWSCIYNIEVRDNFAYCAFGFGLVIYDLTDSYNPVEIARLTLGAAGMWKSTRILPLWLAAPMI